MKAVVMAGGEGTRLRPLTSNQPKPMVPIVGKPCMEHILELLREHGLDDVIVTVAFLPQAIRGYFGNGESLGMPHSRPMPSIGPRCHELRVRAEDQNWRIIYRLDADAVVIVAVVAKATQQTPKHVIDSCQRRLRAYDEVVKSQE